VKSRSVNGTIMEVDFADDLASIEIQYGQITSIADIATGNTLPTTVLGYRLIPDSKDDMSMDLAGRRIFHFFELIEGVRALVNSAGSAQTGANQVYAAPPLLSRLSVASPMVIIVQLAQAAQPLLLLLYLRASIKAMCSLIDKRLIWYQGSVAKEQARQEALHTGVMVDATELDARLKLAEVELREAEAASASANTEMDRIILQRLREQ
jgi:hypothetical protein